MDKLEKGHALLCCCILLVIIGSSYEFAVAKEQNSLRINGDGINAFNITPVIETRQELFGGEMYSINRAFVNNKGDVVFSGKLQSNRGISYGIWLWDYVSHEYYQIARTDMATDIPTILFEIPSPVPSINVQKQVAFRTKIKGDGIDTDYNGALYLWELDNGIPELTCLLKELEYIDQYQVTDLYANTPLYNDLMHPVLLNNNGFVIFTAQLDYCKEAICLWEEHAGFRIVAIEDEVMAPPYDNITILNIHVYGGCSSNYLDLNEQGFLVFSAEVTNDVGDFYEILLRYNTSADTYEIPYANHQYGFRHVCVNDLGMVVYGKANGPYCYSNSILLENEVIAKQQDSTPMTLAPGLPADYAGNGEYGGCFFEFRGPSCAGTLPVAFYSKFCTVYGHGASCYFDDALYSTASGNVLPVVYENQSAPGFSSEIVFSDRNCAFSYPVLNRQRKVAFLGTLSHYDAQTDEYDEIGSALYINDSKKLHCVLYEGSTTHFSNYEIDDINFGSTTNYQSDYEWLWVEKPDLDNGLGAYTNSGAMIVRIELDGYYDKDGFYLMEPKIGDCNFDGIVDQSDLGILLASYERDPNHPLFDPRADFNGDGYVNQQDLGLLLANYEQ